MKRRTLLGTSTAALSLGTAGCVSWPPWATPAGQDSENNGDADGAESTSESDQEETPDDTNKNEQGQQDNEQPQEQEQEQEDDKQQDDPSGPSEEDTEIDRDQYEEQEVSETEARSSDDIEVAADPQQHDDGSVTVTGTVTNVSDSSIDVVDLEMIFSDADDQYLGSDLATIRGLDSGASTDFEGGASAHELQGDIAHVRINPDVYDTK